MRTFTIALTTAAGLVAGAGAQNRNAGRPAPHHVFVRVLDRAGSRPVLDLRPGDFEVTEGGVKREVVGATLANTPMRIALIIDTSDGAANALNHIRTGLAQFLDALPPEHEVMIVSTGRQVRVRIPPTTDRKKLGDVAKALFSDGGAEPLMDGLLEIDDRFLRKAEDRWPVFVIITGDGAESSAGANEKKFNDWLRVLPARGVSAHAVVMKFKGGGTPEIFANHVVETAGGLYEFINTSNSLPEKMKAIGDRLARDFASAQSKYDVAYVTDSPEVQRVSVGVSRDGVILEMSNTRTR